ncbi:MAG: PLP-dependent aminotransferase family protein [Dechloromonas sp.]|nr:MAG: PLP-dependent aminotransferase family protein [Dechloromonas sp.]
MRRASELELALGERPDGMTLQRWLCAELRTAILAGRIAPGTRLPSTRDIARQQGISRGTALAAYEQLIAEGYLNGTTGSGTTVAPALPVALLAGDSVADVRRASLRLSRQGRLLADSPFAAREGATSARPFSPNQPDLRAFPRDVWHRLCSRQSRSTRPDDMGYADPAGDPLLRRAIAEHLRFAQRIACTADNVMILASAQQALDLCARLLLDAGDSALVEDPGYPGAARIFALTGAEVLGLPVDAGGMRTEALPPGRLAYVTAAHQSPLGGTLPVDRRLALLAWADAQDAVIIEDDYDGEYRFDSAPLPAMKSLDRNGRVIYLGTFSKLLFPALRLAYVVVPDGLAEAFAAAISLTCRHQPMFQQAVLAAFIADGHFARHLRQMRQLYGERAACFARECHSQLAGLLRIEPITTGLDATALLPAGSDDRAVAATLEQCGIAARPVSFYRLQRTAPPGLVMGFSSFGEEAIRRGVAAMLPALETLME